MRCTSEDPQFKHNVQGGAGLVSRCFTRSEMFWRRENKCKLLREVQGGEAIVGRSNCRDFVARHEPDTGEYERKLA